MKSFVWIGFIAAVGYFAFSLICGVADFGHSVAGNMKSHYQIEMSIND